MKVGVLVHLLGLAGAAQAFSVQGVFQDENLFKNSLDSLGEMTKELAGSLNWNMMGMPTLFPGSSSSDLLLTSEPRAKIVPHDKWDFHVQSAQVENYKLRVKKVTDPYVLGIDPGVKQYSGYLDVEQEDKHFFYWFFESRNDPANDPVILWLNGGPGCSSLLGLFFELGPSSIDENLNPVNNPYSWNANASIIFLDQPVNVGYSYSSSPVTGTVAASKDVYAFLQLFFQQFPEYQSGQKFHIAGESYSGHYIPVIASEILSHPTQERFFNLSSILIGNGLTDPLTQASYYEPMACGRGGAPAVLDKDQCLTMNNSLPRCLSLIQSCYTLQSVWTCVPASLYCNYALLSPYQRAGKNPYDVRKGCHDTLCYDQMNYQVEYLNKPEVMAAVGSEVDFYESCNLDINRNFLLNGDWMKPYHTHVTKLLNAGLPVLIYSGDKDFICNWLGGRAWVDALPWVHSKEFSNQPVLDWHVPSGEKAGEVKNYKHFTFLRFFDAGHMVPFDKPENALNMLNSWLNHDYSFQNSK